MLGAETHSPISECPRRSGNSVLETPGGLGLCGRPGWGPRAGVAPRGGEWSRGPGKAARPRRPDPTREPTGGGGPRRAGTAEGPTAPRRLLSTPGLGASPAQPCVGLGLTPSCGTSAWSPLSAPGHRGAESGPSPIGLTWYLGRPIINNVDSGGISLPGSGRVTWDTLCGSAFSRSDLQNFSRPFFDWSPQQSFDYHY